MVEWPPEILIFTPVHKSPMLALAVFLPLSHSYFCKVTLNVTTNFPESFEGPLGDGDRLCINSTVPFLAVTFQQTTLLKVRYYSRDAVSSRVDSGDHFFIPSEIAAVGFGDTLGQVEVQALIPGLVSISIFAYPRACAQGRYVTTMKDDSFWLAERLALGQWAAIVSDYAL
jgi:hypothetical protein